MYCLIPLLFKERYILRTYLVVQKLRLHTSDEGGMGLIPDGVTKISNAVQPNKKRKIYSYMYILKDWKDVCLFFVLNTLLLKYEKNFFEMCKGLTRVKTIWIILTEKPNQKKIAMFNVMQFWRCECCNLYSFLSDLGWGLLHRAWKGFLCYFLNKDGHIYLLNSQIAQSNYQSPFL